MQEIKTLMLGGTFDPIHRGHLFLLRKAIENTSYKRYVLVPAHLSNFKQAAEPSATDSQRLEMTKLAIEDFIKDTKIPDDVEIIVSDIEITRKGISYTYNTVMELKKIYSVSARLGLLMGDDHIDKLSSWYRFQDLKREVEFIICRREPENRWNRLPKDIVCTQIESPELSPEASSLFRENPALHSEFLTPSVYKYIKENGLYV